MGPHKGDRRAGEPFAQSWTKLEFPRSQALTLTSACCSERGWSLEGSRTVTA